MSFRLGVDVGELLQIFCLDEIIGSTTAGTYLKISNGCLNGVSKICEQSSIDPKDISLVMHGTTVATNAVLTGNIYIMRKYFAGC